MALDRDFRQDPGVKNGSVVRERGVKKLREPGDCGGGTSCSPFAQFDGQPGNKGLKLMSHQEPYPGFL